mgnify:FL=1
MMNRKIVLLLILLISFFGLSDTKKELYSFSDIERQERFIQLQEIYRCPKCQSSSLASSNSLIAKDLKGQIYKLIEEGKTDKEIETYLRSRYGDFIVYKPPFRKNTLILWLGPFLFLIVVFAWVMIRKIVFKSEVEDLESEKIVKAAEKTRLKNLFEGD